MRQFLLFLVLLSIVATNAQVGINTTTPSDAAVLDISSSSDGVNFGGLLLPKVDATGRANIVSKSEASDEGLLIYYTVTRCIQIWNGTDLQFEDVYCMPSGGSFTALSQDFDLNLSWSYTSSPAPYAVGGDIWNIVSLLNTITTLTNNFWGAQDLDNPNGGGSFRHTLTFATVNTSAATGVTFSFDYESSGMNATNDRYGYELFYDGTSQGEVDICNDCDTALDGTITINVPNAVNSFHVILYGQFNGGSDYAAFDNIQISN